VGPYLPVLTETVLLPFKGMIVYDGLMTSYRISFGPGIRRSLNESFKEAKARHGIVTTLPMSDEPLPVRAPKARPVPKPPSKEDKDEALRAVSGSRWPQGGRGGGGPAVTARHQGPGPGLLPRPRVATGQ